MNVGRLPEYRPDFAFRKASAELQNSITSTSLPILYNDSFHWCFHHFKLATRHVGFQINDVACVNQVHPVSIVRPRTEMQIAFLVIERKELNINGATTL